MHGMVEYSDRKDAGQKLAQLLLEYANRDDVLVLGLPRGGIPVACEVAEKLHAPLDVFIVRKLGVPGQEELAMGAIASGGIRVLNEDIIHHLDIPDTVVEDVARREQVELERRAQAYRADLPAAAISGRIVILVDDGLATGASMRAAALALRERQPIKIIVAVPVGAVETCRTLQHFADQVICAATPEPFYGVGAWYADFSQTSDEEVRDCLLCANQSR